MMIANGSATAETRIADQAVRMATWGVRRMNSIREGVPALEAHAGAGDDALA